MSKITYTNKIALNENANIPNVNKVTDDDMNEIKAVVNNNDDIVTNATTYSTTETVVGKWIDGKPIYRKVYSFSALSGNNSYTLNPAPSNVDKMWFDLSGTFLEESNGTTRQGIDSSAVDSSYDFSARVVSNTRTFVNILVGGSVYNGSTIYVTLLYTKTTD